MRSSDSMPHNGGWCKAAECINLPECPRPDVLTAAGLENKYWCVDCEWCQAHQPIPYTIVQGEVGCDGYNHPYKAIRQSSDGEWACYACGVTLV
jgi:hypothetical protein